jgi:hypothetical protein
MRRDRRGWEGSTKMVRMQASDLLKQITFVAKIFSAGQLVAVQSGAIKVESPSL